MGTPVDPVAPLIREALAAASSAPGYPTTAGTPALRASAAAALNRRYGVTGLADDTVLPVIGTKELIAWLPTLLGLGLVMTWFLMQPVLIAVEQQAVTPYRNGQVTGWEAMDRGAVPIKTFLLRYAREKDLALFAAAGQIPRPAKPEDLPLRAVIPAYMLSELKAGFAIGAVLYLPFLLIDMVTAAITTSIGMFQLPPVVVSTPLKILLFVMVDGWNLVASSLLKSF